MQENGSEPGERTDRSSQHDTLATVAASSNLTQPQVVESQEAVAGLTNNELLTIPQSIIDAIERDAATGGSRIIVYAPQLSFIDKRQFISNQEIKPSSSIQMPNDSSGTTVTVEENDTTFQQSGFANPGVPANAQRSTEFNSNVPTVCSGSTTNSKRNLPLGRIRQPLGHIKETATLNEIYQNIKQDFILILHCYGVSGGGKSQLIRKLAEKFPFTDRQEQTSTNFIKWHIQCNDSGHDVKQQLNKLIDTLQKKAQIADDHMYQKIKDDIENDKTKTLVDTFLQMSTSVLIVVEDPPSSCTKLLKDLLHNLDKKSEEKVNKFHVYITSKKSQIMSADEFEKMKCYKAKNIRGFNKEEALDFLTLDGTASGNHAAARVYEHFNGLPFALQAAKHFCENSRIGYSDYLVLLKDNEYEINENEIKTFAEEYGNQAKDILISSVMLFLPSDDIDVNTELHWRILGCMSHLHYDRMPRYVIERFVHILRSQPVKTPEIKNRSDCGQLITKLLQHGMCTETNKGEITFYEVVLAAFKLLNKASRNNEGFNPFKKAAEVLSGIISKDMREAVHRKKMFKIRRHVQTYLNNLEENDNVFDDERDLVLLHALTSHLYETTASIMLAESPYFWSDCEKYFRRALEILWGKSIVNEFLETMQKDHCDLEKLSKLIVNMSERKSATLSDDFVSEYVSRIEMSFEKSEQLEFLKSKSSGNFETVTDLIKQNQSKKTIIKKLQECNVFLKDNAYRPIFFAERLAHIFHSWSRMTLFADHSSQSDHKKFKMMSLLSLSVSEECCRSHKIPLISEWLSGSIALPSIMLKQKKDARHLQKALHLCEKALSKSPEASDVYENGLLKNVFEPSYLSTRISLLRLIVRAHTRLIKQTDESVFSYTCYGDQKCTELLELATGSDTISNNLMCLIYCAKYYAAKGDFVRSLDLFHKYFGLTINIECRPLFNVHCWAVYNYARAVCCCSQNREKKNSLKLCNEVLGTNDVMSHDLNHLLRNTKDELEKMPDAVEEGHKQ